MTSTRRLATAAAAGTLLMLWAWLLLSIAVLAGFVVVGIAVQTDAGLRARREGRRVIGEVARLTAAYVVPAMAIQAAWAIWMASAGDALVVVVAWVLCAAATGLLVTGVTAGVSALAGGRRPAAAGQRA
jgi:hypothetical protein